MQSPPSDCLSVRSSVGLFPLYLQYQLTVDLELLRVSISHDHSLQGIENQGHKSRSRSWVTLMQSVRPRSRAVPFTIHSITQHL